MDQIEKTRGERPFPTTPKPESSKSRISFWQAVLLILILASFLAALVPTFETRSSSQLSSIVYLAEDESGVLQLFTASGPAWQPSQLTDETAVILNYAPSPDGSQVAYAIAMPNGSTQIKLLQLPHADSLQVILTCANAECSQPVWHPDGRRLLYERREPPNSNRPQLWWLNIKSGETILLREEATTVGSNARFSPDGNWVSFAASPDEGIRLYNFTGCRSITFPSNVGTPTAWHPSSNQLLYQNSRSVVFHSEDNDNHDEHGHDFATAVSLYLSDPDTQNSQLLNNDGAFNDGNAAWSPDGQWIAFGRRLARTNTGRQLWLMRTNGAEAHALTDDIAQHHGPPTWSPDGRFLLFQKVNTTVANQRPSLWLLEIATGDLNNIINNGLLPTWLP